MAIQTTSLDTELDKLEDKAEEYDTRTNTEERVTQAKADLSELNRTLGELKEALDDFERQAGILTEVFSKSLPSEANIARDTVRSKMDVSQDDILEIIDDGGRSLSTHTEDLRETRETVKSATRTINDQLKQIQQSKISNASTAESIQKIVGEEQEAMDTIRRYRSFLNMILNPNSSVSELKKQWQGLEKAFENLDTNWEGFQQRHDLSDETIDDLKTLSQDGGVYLDKLTIQSVTEMMEVSELRSTIMVSI